MKKINIAVLANCQGGPIKALLANNISSINFIDIPYIHMLKRDNFDEVILSLEEVDFIIMQPLSSRFEGLSFKNIQKKYKKKLIVFPVIFFNGYNPEMIYLRDYKGASIRNFIIDYHDLFILYGYITNKSEKAVLKWFSNPNLLDNKTIKNIWEDSLRKLKDTEKDCNIVVSNLIEKSFNDKLFNTLNHPTNTIIEDVVRQIINIIGIEKDFIGFKNKILNNVQIPSYSNIKKYFNFNNNNFYTINGENFSKEEMISKYYKFYDTLDINILRHNLNNINSNLKNELFYLQDIFSNAIYSNNTLSVSTEIYDNIGINFYSKYRFGKLTKFYNRSEELSELNRGIDYIKSLKGKYKGKRCFIIGNGPSLNEQNLTLLKDEFTIGSNYIYMNYEKMGFYPTIFTIVNYLVAEQRIDEINNLPESIKIFPYFLNYCIEKDDRTFFLNSAAVKEFSTDLTKNISWQSTVTFFNMQLAYYLGFDEVYLIGVDNSYIQPKNGVEGSMVEQEEDDPNHFCNTYFKGLTWQKADTNAMEYVYYLTKEIFDNSQQKIYNATHGGKLEVFERVKYENLFTNKLMSTTNIDNKYKYNTCNNHIISINPDLEDAFGHYLHYDLCIENSLDKNTDLYILSNKKAKDDLLKTNRKIIPTFRDKSWNIGLPEQRTIYMDQIFKLEFKNFLNIFEDLDGEKIFIFYTGSLTHAILFLDIIEENKININIHINLFREHFNLNYIKENKTKILNDILKIKENDNIKLYIDSDELNKEFKNILNITFDRWPMFPITNFNVPINNSLLNKKDDNLKIVFPGNLRLEKGFDLSIKVANSLSKVGYSTFIRVTYTNVKDQRIKDLVQNISNNVNIIEGILTEEEYLILIKLSDIIVLPYKVSEFKTRTSGLMADAIYLNKPVVAAKNTYMGNIIEKYNNGVVYDTENEEELENAIKKLSKNYNYYLDNAKKCAKEWLKENNVNKLIEIFNISEDV